MKPNRFVFSLIAAPLAWLPTAAHAQTVSTGPSKEKPAESVAAATLTPAIKLQKVEILGSRIQRAEGEGPSPVSNYDKDFIRSTGALNLADFLNYLPQTYSGIGSGRGSSPSELNPEFGQRTETTLPGFNFVTGNASAPPGQTGVSGVSLRGLGSGSTLVLVDGRRVAQSGGGNRGTDSRQGFVDLNTIPLGMIERVEIITDGASALYGADAVAGVINIVLKKNWVGTEVSANYKGTFDGGGTERQAMITTGFAKGRINGTVALEYYTRADLRADQRSFSANQNHTGLQSGTDSAGAIDLSDDLRMLWGHPAVIQARTGDFLNVTGPGGTPVRVALVPEGATSTPALGQFTLSQTIIPPAATPAGSGQRRGNTAEFLDLIPPSERWGASGTLNYKFSPTLEIYSRYSYSNTKGSFHTQPGVSSSSATTGFGNFATVVPAALNPFGQDVMVGLIHYGFGSVRQETETKAHSVVGGIRGNMFETWRWDSALTWQSQDFHQRTRDFNGAAITGMLINPDASLRLNPFVDQRTPGNAQANIYEQAAIYQNLTTDSDLRTWDFTANGDLFSFWGGPVGMAWGGSAERAENKSESVNHSVAANPVATRATAAGRRTSWAAFAEVAVPIVGRPNAKPLIRRLDLQLAARHEDRDDAGNVTIPKLGVVWVPVTSLLLRSSYSEGFRAPGLTEYQVATSTSTATFLDPRRTPSSTTGVISSRGSNPDIRPETSTSETYGVIWEPTFVKALSFNGTYYITKQNDAIQVLSGQVIVNNEALFADRITRLAPDAADIALGQPGRLSKVNITLINFGRGINESVDFGAEYTMPTRALGRWRINLNASRTLKSTRELRVGLPELDDAGDTFSPPKWKLTNYIFWDRGAWSANAFVTYLDGFTRNQAGNALSAAFKVPSVTKVDLRGGYTFVGGIWRGYGKGLRVGVGMGNIFDQKPPLSNTVFGYNGGLHSHLVMGRTYELSFNAPF